jgi:ubiquinone/menaquinone biosynthesis C-methylase UbiE
MLWKARTSVNKDGLVQGSVIAENANNFLRLKEGDVLADLGCGPGVIAKYLAPKLGKTGWLYALDASPGMLENAEKSLTGIQHTTIHGDIQTVDKLIKEKVDAVLLSGNIHLLSNPEKALKAISRIMKPMGRLVIVCHAYFHGEDNNTNYFAQLIDSMMENRPDSFAQGLRLPLLSQRELKRIKGYLVKSGFSIQQMESDTWSPDTDDVFGRPPQKTIKDRFKAMGLNLSELDAERKAQSVMTEVLAGRQAQIYLQCTKTPPIFKFAMSSTR